MNQFLCTTLLTLAAIALLGNNPISLERAIAESSLVPAPSLQREATEILTATETNLPPQIQTAVLEAAASRTSRPVATLKIVEAQPRNWSDGCLGLAKPDELCTQVITPGWQVVVTDGLRNWTYRTNELGNVIKLEKLP